MSGRQAGSAFFGAYSRMLPSQKKCLGTHAKYAGYMYRATVILGILIIGLTVSWIFPLFHVERLEQSKQTISEVSSADRANTIWNAHIAPALAKAPEASTVVISLRTNPSAARNSFGRKVGVSRTTLYLMQGTGTVVAADKKGVSVSLESSAKEPEIVLRTGLLFGNTVRDVTGLVNSGDFQDSREFNDVSTELNRIVETRVVAKLKDATIGKHIHFVGCTEIPDQASVATTLSIIPMEVQFESEPITSK
jgi:predicted lipoprotein